MLIKKKDKTNNFEWFFLAFHELMGVSDTAQLSFLIQGINAEFEVTEELASKNSLCETTKSTLFLRLEN